MQLRFRVTCIMGLLQNLQSTEVEILRLARSLRVYNAPLVFDINDLDAYIPSIRNTVR